METQLKQTRRVVMEWWERGYGLADARYRRWLTLSALDRNALKIHDITPKRFEPIEDWFYPRILAVMPSKLKDSIVQEKTYGVASQTCDVIFKLLKLMQPGSLE